MSHHQNARENCTINVAKSSFDNMAQFKYLGMMFEKNVPRKIFGPKKK
jgi:hypothetical protein